MYDQFFKVFFPRHTVEASPPDSKSHQHYSPFFSAFWSARGTQPR